MIVGLFIDGIGIVPVAMLATLFKARWADFGGLMLMTTLTFGTRAFGAWLGASAN